MNNSILSDLVVTAEVVTSLFYQTGRFPKWPWRTLGGLCGAVACASLADLCTGPLRSSSFAHTVVLASSTCSQDDQLLVIERPGGTDMNCDLLSGIRVDVDVLDARLAEIRSAHVSGASGQTPRNDAQA